MAKMELKSLNMPDEVRTFPNGRLELVRINGTMVGRAVLEPGWRWSTSVKPIAKTKSCKAPHFQYHVAGRLKVRMDNGIEREFRAGDVSRVSSGHDAWVVGNKPAVIVDFQGMRDYAHASTNFASRSLSAAHTLHKLMGHTREARASARGGAR